METKNLLWKVKYLRIKKKGIFLTSIYLEDMLQDNYESISLDKKLKDLIELIKRGEKIYSL